MNQQELLDEMLRQRAENARCQAFAEAASFVRNGNVEGWILDQEIRNAIADALADWARAKEE